MLVDPLAKASVVLNRERSVGDSPTFSHSSNNKGDSPTFSHSSNNKGESPSLLFKCPISRETR